MNWCVELRMACKSDDAQNFDASRKLWSLMQTKQTPQGISRSYFRDAPVIHTADLWLQIPFGMICRLCIAFGYLWIHVLDEWRILGQNLAVLLAALFAKLFDVVLVSLIGNDAVPSKRYKRYGFHMFLLVIWWSLYIICNAAVIQLYNVIAAIIFQQSFGFVLRKGLRWICLVLQAAVRLNEQYTWMSGTPEWAVRLNEFAPICWKKLRLPCFCLRLPSAWIRSSEIWWPYHGSHVSEPTPKMKDKYTLTWLEVDVGHLCPQGLWGCLCSGHTIRLVRMLLHACAELNMLATTFFDVPSLLTSWNLTRSHWGISLFHVMLCHGCAASIFSTHISWLCSCWEDIGKPSCCALLYAECWLLSWGSVMAAFVRFAFRACRVCRVSLFSVRQQISPYNTGQRSEVTKTNLSVNWQFPQERNVQVQHGATRRLWGLDYVEMKGRRPDSLKRTFEGNRCLSMPFLFHLVYLCASAGFGCGDVTSNFTRKP